MFPLEIHIPLTVKEEKHIKLTVKDSGGSQYPYYIGETVITPKVREETELETKNKILLENIIVEEIPYYETSNIKGTTFIVGGN